jgi:hypothetical protein
MPGMLGSIKEIQMVSLRQIPIGEGGTPHGNPMFEEAPEDEDESAGFNNNMSDEEEAPEDEDESAGFNNNMSDEERAYYDSTYYGPERKALRDNLGLTFTKKRLSSEETLDAFAEMIDWMRTNLKNHYENLGLTQKMQEVSTWTNEKIIITHKSINDDHVFK